MWVVIIHDFHLWWSCMRNRTLIKRLMFPAGFSRRSPAAASTLLIMDSWNLRPSATRQVARGCVRFYLFYFFREEQRSPFSLNTPPSLTSPSRGGASRWGTCAAVALRVPVAARRNGAACWTMSRRSRGTQVDPKESTAAGEITCAGMVPFILKPHFLKGIHDGTELIF